MTAPAVLDNIAHTRIAPSPIHGLGLFSVNPLPAGTILVILDGQVVPWSVYTSTRLCDEWNALPGERLLVRPYRTRYSFINHSRTPNAAVTLLPTTQVKLETLRDIRADEEITLDYRNEPLPAEYLATHGRTYL